MWGPCLNQVNIWLPLLNQASCCGVFMPLEAAAAMLAPVFKVPIMTLPTKHYHLTE